MENKNSKKKIEAPKYVELFFLGGSTDFYWQSGTCMSNIYHVGTFERSDWGQVQMLLKEGYELRIRPANGDEELWAFKKLVKIQEKMARLKAAGTTA